MSRLLIFAVVVFGIWWVFFRKKRVQNDGANAQNGAQNGVNEMVECAVCRSFVAKDEAIFASGRWYCSKECLIKAG